MEKLGIGLELELSSCVNEWRIDVIKMKITWAMVILMVVVGLILFALWIHQVKIEKKQDEIGIRASISHGMMRIPS